jgi:two-component system sensor histidine kinase TctE
LARNEVDVKLHPLDVATMAREVARDWTPRALKAGVDLGFDGAEHVMIAGEGLLLREALNNLIDNALTYAGRGSEVTLSVRTQGTDVVLEVADNGPGLVADDVPRVFERFWRASDLPGGCGLGLAIVSEIAQRHGGRATSLAVHPQGLKVQMWLPAITLEAAL